MRETRLGNGPPTEPGRTARLCSRLSGPQGKGTARQGTEASGLGGTKTRTQNFSPPRAGPDHSRPPSPRLKTETRRPAVHGPQGDTRGAHGGPARGRGLRAASLPGGVWASSGPNLSGTPFPVEPCRCVSADVSSRQGWERTLSHTIRSATSLFPRSLQISSRSF